MAKQREIVKSEKQLNDIIGDKGYYYTALSKGRFQYVIDCILSLYFDENSDEAKNTSKQVGAIDLMEKKSFYTLLTTAVKELSINESFSLEQINPINNVEKLMNYISGLHNSLTPIFKIVKIQAKKNPVVIKWIKHNEIICSEALKLMKNVNNLSNNMKSYNKMKSFNFRKTLVQPIQSDVESILFYLQTILTTDPEDQKALISIKKAERVKFKFFYEPKLDKKEKNSTSNQENKSDSSLSAPNLPPPPPPSNSGKIPIQPVRFEQHNLNKRIMIISFKQKTVEDIEKSIINALHKNNFKKITKGIVRIAAKGSMFASGKFLTDVITTAYDTNTLNNVDKYKDIYYKYINLKELAKNVVSDDSNFQFSLALGLFNQMEVKASFGKSNIGSLLFVLCNYAKESSGNLSNFDINDSKYQNYLSSKVKGTK